MMGATKVPVQVATVQPGLIDQTLNAIATVKPLQTVAIRGEVDGVLERVHFKDGQRVQAGDLLVEIDPRTYQVQLDQARGQLAQSQAQLKGAQQELARHRVLFQQNSIARQALETKETAVQQLQAQIKLIKPKLPVRRYSWTALVSQRPWMVVWVCASWIRATWCLRPIRMGLSSLLK